MIPENLAITSVRDPLTRTTRRERTSLLGVSAVCIAITKAGLVPSKISALGVEFSQASQQSLFHVLAAVVGYYFVAFILYAAADFVPWRIRYTEAFGEMVGSPEYKAARSLHSISLKRKSAFAQFQEDNKSSESERPPPRAHFALALSWIIYGLRALFEFLVPLLVAIYAIHALVTTPPPAAPCRSCCAKRAALRSA